MIKIVSKYCGWCMAIHHYERKMSVSDRVKFFWHSYGYDVKFALQWLFIYTVSGAALFSLAAWLVK